MELENLTKRIELETVNLLDDTMKILKCIEISKTFEDANENFKVITVTLKKLLQKLEICLNSVFTKKKRIRARVCLSQIGKCIPMLLFTLQNHDDYSSTECKRYLLKRLEVCFVEIKNLLVNKTDMIEDAEGEGCRFVHTMNAALQVISCIESAVHTQSLDASIHCVNVAVEDLLSRAMYIFQVSCHSRKDEFQATCSKVSRALLKLTKDCLAEEKNGTAIRCSGLALRAALEDLEHNVNKILLHLYLEVFSDPFNILLKIRQACENSPEHANFRHSSDLPVEEFDRHMECLLILGQFAIATSENAKRVLEMSSCVASLESLDTEMVAALTTLYLQPKNRGHSCYVDQLMVHYRNEVLDLRKKMDTVVDPATFCSVAEVEIRRLVKVFRKAISEPAAILKGLAIDVVNKTEMLLDLVEVVIELEDMQPISPEISSSILSLVKLARKACRMCSKTVSKLCDEVTVNDERQKMLKRLKFILNYVKRMSPVLEELMNDYHHTAYQELEKYSSNDGSETSAVAGSSSQPACEQSVQFPDSIGELPIDVDTHDFSLDYNLSPRKIMRESILYKRSVANTAEKVLPVLAVEDVFMVKPQMLFSRRRFHSTCSVVAPTEAEDEMNRTLSLEITEILEQLSDMPDTLTSELHQASHSTAEEPCEELEDVEMQERVHEDEPVHEQQHQEHECEQTSESRFSVNQDSIENVRTFHSATMSSKILKFIRKKYCRFRKMYRLKNCISNAHRGKTGKLSSSRWSRKVSQASRVSPAELGQVNGHLCSPTSPLCSDERPAVSWESQEAQVNGVPFCESVRNCSTQEVNPQTLKDLRRVGNVCSLESSRRHSNNAVNNHSSDAYK